jgi:FkbM family methyltransferase
LEESQMAEKALPIAPAWVRMAAKFSPYLPAGRYVAMNRISQRPPEAFLMTLPADMGGSLYECDLRDSIAREACFTGRYEPLETAILRNLLEPGMTFVDVGANWGYFTLLASSCVGESGRVVSLEPDPRLFRILQENVTRNGLAQVVPLQLAAADAAGVLDLQACEISGGNWGLSKLVDSTKATGNIFQVLARPLDVVLDDLGIEHVDLLKMDIEGAEEIALHGMSVGLAEYRYRRIILEVHPALLTERGSSTEKVIALLRDIGYKGEWIDHSPPGAKRAAYTRSLSIDEFMHPLDSRPFVDAWPHILWECPDLISR